MIHRPRPPLGPERPHARATGFSGWGLNIEFERGFGGKLRWLIRLQTGI